MQTSDMVFIDSDAPRHHVWYNKYSGLYSYQDDDSVWQTTLDNDGVAQVIPAWKPNALDGSSRLVYGTAGAQIDSSANALQRWYHSGLGTYVRQYGDPTDILQSPLFPSAVKTSLYNSVYSHYDSTYGYLLTDADAVTMAGYTPQESSWGYFVAALGWYTAALAATFLPVAEGLTFADSSGTVSAINQSVNNIDLWGNSVNMTVVHDLKTWMVDDANMKDSPSGNRLIAQQYIQQWIF